MLLTIPRLKRIQILSGLLDRLIMPSIPEALGINTKYADQFNKLVNMFDVWKLSGNPKKKPKKIAQQILWFLQDGILSSSIAGFFWQL